MIIMCVLNIFSALWMNIWIKYQTEWKKNTTWKRKFRKVFTLNGFSSDNNIKKKLNLGKNTGEY